MKQINKIVEKFKTKPLNAVSAYSVATYGSNMTDDDVIEEKIKLIKSSIENKCNNGEFAVISSLDPKVPKLVDTIKQHFIDLGFNVEIINKELFSYVNIPYIFIYWNR